MAVRQRLMAVRVAMVAAGRCLFIMRVLVMSIVAMFMLVFHRLVPVEVTVLFGEVQPDAQCHQCGQSATGR